MTPIDIEEIVNAHPDGAFQLTLSSGDQIHVPHRDAIRISDLKVLIFPDLEPGRLLTTTRPLYISAVNVAMIKPIKPQASPSNN